MSKQWRIIINLAVLLLVGGFVVYMFVLINDKTVEYGEISEEQSNFLSPCTLEATYVLPPKVQRLRLSDNCIHVATSDSILVFSKDNMLCINRFYAGKNIKDIAIDSIKGEIYTLYDTEIKVFAQNGQPVREWEACSDNSLYASIALTENHVWVTDAENLNVCQYSKEGQFIRFINSPRNFIIPTGTFGIETFRDTVWCINSGRHQIENYTVEGKFIASFGVPGSRPGTFSGCSNPSSIAFTPEGQILTSEKGNPRVCLFERSGRFIRMLLNSKSLGGGHEAYEIQMESDKIYVAGNRSLTVFQYKE
ncbi:hypothetical protein FACS1894155_04110 [Bacteroidia bacterium]|nr:hypothetical protein FACS1894155_04110 [Bacteroidia bacterium]